MRHRRQTSHPWFARLYSHLAPIAEQAGAADHRDRLLAGLTGRVIEIGCGSGLNFAHYPASVTEVVAIEPEPYMRLRARAAARSVSVPIRVIDGTGESLEAADGEFDAAVVSLVLCSVSDPSEALREIRRVLRRGGELRFYEHVKAQSPALCRWQRLASPVWNRCAGGCHLDRDTEATLVAAGFEISNIERFDFQPGPNFPLALVRPHILGIARTPEGEQSQR